MLMNKYVINGLVLVFWMILSLSDAWGLTREEFERPLILEIKEEQKQEMDISNAPTVTECSSLFNELQRNEERN